MNAERHQLGVTHGQEKQSRDEKQRSKEWTAKMLDRDGYVWKHPAWGGGGQQKWGGEAEGLEIGRKNVEWM